MFILSLVRQHVTNIYEREVKRMMKFTNVVKVKNVNHSVTSMECIA